ncbi:MAG: methyltransferase domain-containing protein [Betaproteobacteria bacterium]|nr:methyltransferase domain-containing protein [Betaproteobacteria bacterium]
MRYRLHQWLAGVTGGAAMRAAGGCRLAILCAVFAMGCAIGADPLRQPEPRAPDVHFEPTPMRVVQQMLWLADVGSADVVYDLGCGDGRIVVTAARRFGARGVCVDIDPQRIAESRLNARKAGVADRVRFVNEDLFSTDIREATVVMLFLSPSLNLKLRPRLLRELRPGTRIVSHWHDMDDWKPEHTAYAGSGGRDRPIYLWTVPAR